MLHCIIPKCVKVVDPCSRPEVNATLTRPRGRVAKKRVTQCNRSNRLDWFNRSIRSNRSNHSNQPNQSNQVDLSS